MGIQWRDKYPLATFTIRRDQKEFFSWLWHEHRIKASPLIQEKIDEIIIEQKEKIKRRKLAEYDYQTMLRKEISNN